MSNDDQRLGILKLAIGFCRVLASDRGGLTLDDLAERFGVSQRTVRRYVVALRAAGVSIDESRMSQSEAFRYRLDDRAWAGMLYLPDD